MDNIYNLGDGVTSAIIPNDTTSSTLTTVKPGEGPQRGAADEEWIREMKRISYHVLLPVVMVLGVIINAFGLYLLRRPRMRALPSTICLELLFTLNMAYFLFSIGNIITISGCELHSYAVALYVAHPCFTAIYVLQMFSNYVVVWMCCDRFLGLWYFNLFRQMLQPRVMRLRFILTGLFCVGMQMIYFLGVEVLCMTVSDEGVVVANNNTQSCDQGYWFLRNVYHETEEGDVGRNVMMVAIIILGCVVPVVLVLVFSVGIVVGMVRRRIQSMAATSSTLQQAYSAIYVTLALTLVFLINSLLTVVFAIMYTQNFKSCYVSVSREVFRATLHFLLMGERLMLTFFLTIMNQTFREELGTLLHAIQDCFCNALNCLTLSVCPSCQARSPKHNANTLTVFYSNRDESPKALPSDDVTIQGAT